MVHISVRLGEEIANQMGEAINEFQYKTRTEFINEAIRHRLRELKADRAKEVAWHKLLSEHHPKEIARKTWFHGRKIINKIRGPRFTLKDLLKQKHDWEYE